MITVAKGPPTTSSKSSPATRRRASISQGRPSWRRLHRRHYLHPGDVERWAQHRGEENIYRKIADDLHSKAGVRKQDVFINLVDVFRTGSSATARCNTHQSSAGASAGMRGGRHDEQCIVVWSRPQITGDKLAELQSAIYDALMNHNSHQSRFYIAPGTSSARRLARKPYEPQK